MFYLTRFRSQRLDGYRLLLEAAGVGFALTVVARILVVSLRRWPPVKEAWLTAAPNIEFLGTATVAALLGLTVPYGVNWLLDATGWLPLKQARYRAILRNGNQLLRLLHTASAEERLIAVTLDNLKVYVGLIAEAPNLEPHNTHVTIIPFLSGYRVRETLELRLVTDYLAVYDERKLDPQNFGIALPIASIRMAGFFDQDLYAAFPVEPPSHAPPPASPAAGS